MTDAPALPDPSLTFAFEVRVDVDDAVHVGYGSVHEVLMFVPITGGTVAGPRLTDGVIELDAHYLLRDEDGVVIDVANRGFWRATPAVTARLDAGEAVDEREYYYRTSARFRTDAPAYSWLTQSIVVGLARQDGATICIRFFTLD